MSRMQHEPLTPAERQRRRRARLGPAKVNRAQRRYRLRKRKLARRVAHETKAAARERAVATKHAETAAVIAELSATIRRLSNGGGTERRERAASLDRYTVETITEAQALPLIVEHEWLGTAGQATIFVGLFAPTRELQGVACFGHGSTGAIRQRIGAKALCLVRGCCTPEAPANAASFLINNACRLMHRLTGVARFFAYCDPMAGEYGGVYQAAGWTYLGQGLYGSGSNRTRRYAVLAPGRDPSDPASWQTTRVLRRAGRHLSFAEARAAGWQIASRAAKHVYAHVVGRERRAWLKAHPGLEYPKPQPHR
jgi:hypothetical protein